MIRSYLKQKWISNLYPIFIITDMSNIREIIRCLLHEGGFSDETYSWNSDDLLCNPRQIKDDCSELKKGFDLITEDMELSYFSVSNNGHVNGGAWTSVNNNKFNFAIATTQDTPDFIFEELVYDCIDEFSSLQKKNSKIRLEIKVEDEETEKFLREKYKLEVLRNCHSMVIMGKE